MNVDIIAVTDCLCRKQKKLIGAGCSRPPKHVSCSGLVGQYYIDNKLGRKIDKAEALKIVAEAQKSGLVTQPGTSQNPAGMCNCCGDCCAVLGAIKKYPNPSEIAFQIIPLQLLKKTAPDAEHVLISAPWKDTDS